MAVRVYVLVCLLFRNIYVVSGSLFYVFFLLCYLFFYIFFIVGKYNGSVGQVADDRKCNIIPVIISIPLCRRVICYYFYRVHGE
jgi:hypothetical protein